MTKSIRWQMFPKSMEPKECLLDIISVFNQNIDCVNSESYELKSNEVLGYITNDLLALGFNVELSKNTRDKIKVPVLYGENGTIEKFFDADAYSKELRTVVEVEAGRAYSNNQFLKDIFQAAVMDNTDYLVIACRQIYRGSKDYDKIIRFLETLYVSGKFSLDLEGILVIGY